MKTAIYFLLMTTLATAGQLEQKNWHVLTKTENGTVSLIRNLSLAEAVTVYESLADRRGPGIYSVSPSDIRQRELLGPADWDGCLKAMRHKYHLETKLCDGGPNAGRYYRSGSCELCKHHSFEWVDGKP